MSSIELAYGLQLPPQIVFGWGQRGQSAQLCRGIGTRAVVVWGSQTLAASDMGRDLLNRLREAGLSPISLATMRGEPSVNTIDSLTAQLRQLPIAESDFLLAIGGGAAMDTAKALAAMATNSQGGSVRDYLEDVGTGLTLTQPPLPVVAVPTTAGTGSEATKNAVISVADPPVKKSLRHPRLIPRLVVIDPQLTVSCPAEITAHSGLDAITQCIESYISCRGTVMSQLLAQEGCVYGMTHLIEAVEQPHSQVARTAMAHAALMSGMALANSGLGLAHGVAAALGALAGVPHGLACATMLPTAVRANLAVAERKFAELDWAICDFQAKPRLPRVEASQAFLARIETLCQQLRIPRRLSELGVSANLVPALVAGSQGNSLKGNPRPIADAELTQLLEQQL